MLGMNGLDLEHGVIDVVGACAAGTFMDFVSSSESTSLGDMSSMSINYRISQVWTGLVDGKSCIESTSVEIA